jgi:large subunit ribosomal protein L30
MLRIKLIKSTIGHNPRNRATIEALGLKRPHSVVEHNDTPSIRGMIRHVHPLISVEVVAGKVADKPKRAEKFAAVVKDKYVADPAKKAPPKAAAPVKVKAKAATAAPAKAKGKAAETAEAKPKAKPAKKASEKTSKETK